MSESMMPLDGRKLVQSMIVQVQEYVCYVSQLVEH